PVFQPGYWWSSLTTDHFDGRFGWGTRSYPDADVLSEGMGPNSASSRNIAARPVHIDDTEAILLDAVDRCSPGWVKRSIERLFGSVPLLCSHLPLGSASSDR